MSSEEALQKLRVADLKELLSKHHLAQTGKKEDLIKRLVENGVSADGEIQAQNVDAGLEEELVEAPDADADAPEVVAPAVDGTNGAHETNEQSSTDATSTTDLTPEQLALKKRAERFGLPFNPNPTSSSTRTAAAAQKPTSTNGAPASTTSTTTTPAPPAAAPVKAGAIDKTPLGVSPEILAQRAAKFGIPEKKDSPAAGAAGVAAGKTPAAPSVKALKTAEVEVTPEMAAKIAEEEEKRKKRAAKFGTGAPAPAAGAKHAAESTAGDASGEPDAKKAKV